MTGFDAASELARDADIERVVRHVLPAANLGPDGLSVPRGFARRAQRSGSPRPFALNNIRALLVYVGPIDTLNPAEAAPLARDLSWQTLSEHARAVCRHLVASWLGSDGEAHAAVFGVVG